jgi:hypothetical protein
MTNQVGAARELVERKEAYISLLREKLAKVEKEFKQYKEFGPPRIKGDKLGLVQ